MTHRFRICLVSIVAALCLSFVFETEVAADLTYSMSVTSLASNSSNMATDVATTVFLKGRRKRVEVHGTEENRRIALATITCPDLGEVITVDLIGKIYKVQPMHSILEILAFPEFPLLNRGDNSQLRTNDNGITISAEGDGSDILHGMDAYHMKLSLHDITENASRPFNSISIDYWVAAQPTGYSIRSSDLVSRPDGSTISYDTSGDRDLVNDLTAKMPVKVVVHSDGEPDTTLDLTAYNGFVLPSSLFNIPSGFELVSEQQFADAERRTAPFWADLSLQR